MTIKIYLIVHAFYESSTSEWCVYSFVSFRFYSLEKHKKTGDIHIYLSLSGFCFNQSLNDLCIYTRISCLYNILFRLLLLNCFSRKIEKCVSKYEKVVIIVDKISLMWNSADIIRSCAMWSLCIPIKSWWYRILAILFRKPIK